MAYEQLSPEQMDGYAKEAGDELLVMCEEGSIPELADWWRRWYMKAGHKRLARLLMRIK